MIYKKRVTLKNSKSCLLRNAIGEDAKEVLDIFNLTHSQTDYLLSYPDENNFTVDEEREFLIKKLESKNEIEICAIVDSKIVATAGINAVGNLFKIKHRAEFGIGIDKEYWNLGIGKELTTACIECAKKAGYKQLELNVVSENSAAIYIYKKLGFSEYGRNPKGFFSRENGWQEIVLMRLELN